MSGKGKKPSGNEHSSQSNATVFGYSDYNEQTKKAMTKQRQEKITAGNTLPPIGQNPAPGKN